MQRFEFINDNTLSKVEQVAESIKRNIEKGLLQRNELLPTINEFSSEYKVARDTIEKAYQILKKMGYVRSFPGKGYFVIGKEKKILKILLVFNKLSSFKKIIYDAFLKTLGDKAKVDLQIHHYDPKLLKEILEANLGKYHYYVIMPHFYLNANKKECLKILEMIPENELILLDKRMPGFKSNCTQIYQDFKSDIYEALHSGVKSISKYKNIRLVLNKVDHHPPEIIMGATQFAKEQKKSISVISRNELFDLEEKTIYVVTTDDDLALLLKQIRLLKMQFGKDIGIISFNETVFKELLDITVITTDFEMMGKTAAQCILDGKQVKAKNPFFMIRRKSL